MKLSFLNLTNLKIPQDFFERISEVVKKVEKIKEDFEVEVVLVGQNRIRTINKRFAGMNQVTDVLSFLEAEVKKPTKKELNFRKFSNILQKSLGEILLCPSRIKKQSKRFKKRFKEELAFCFIHGFLHLLGYDHKEKLSAEIMEEKEEEIMRSLRHTD